MTTHTVYAIRNNETGEYYSLGTGNYLTRWEKFPKFTPYITRRWAQRKLNMIVESRSVVSKEGLGIVAIQVTVPEGE